MMKSENDMNLSDKETYNKNISDKEANSMNISDKNSNKNSNNKKSDTKIYVIFAVALVVSMLAGVLMGVASSVVKAMGMQVPMETVKHIVSIAAPIVFAAFLFVLTLISLIVYAKAAKQAKEWDGEDEDVIDGIEDALNIPMTLSSVMLVGNFFLFTFGVFVSEPADGGKIPGVTYGILGGLFLLGFVAVIVVQMLAVNLEKKLNPEKQGNILDFKFMEKWEKSSDEAQMLTQYKGGYKSFKATSFACMFAWLLSFLGMMMFNTGFMAVACVCAIWFVSVISYSLEVAKLEKKKNKKS